ncbi:CDP-diacylglycerol--glycerol-3-phosphate 3-phosphatidyltransferase [Thermosyntropha lipolytica DSM 11003]|uniref:CDP-diacylglycerol--glycerol-3-phosphate 3-phosphatidyltransferase n=1 Tax=Thermosyntropha lipolytica DSM 11003 TaxID=1123382 RepID=A0A1M5MGF8_9FIRM|nr:CDP-alcohol phosphatidyltransferase family protein [Thermosyntropha lipolytica]SHG75773.1 CDP-diacylglycerol--glycerol-3-phosphate 3-phosphatidyltransferase [Thermosyntropha lipolytica DSM 11003]
MLDTYGRKYINPLIDFLARKLIQKNIKPDHITIAALITGLSCFFFILAGQNLIAFFLLWLSGLLDTLDGAAARQIGKPTAWGTFLDITFDRLVEAGIILALAVKNPSSLLVLLVLTITILLSMTIFLTVGALARQKGIKSFYYQAGLMERTEGFILFSLMLLFPSHLTLITCIFAALIGITILQRAAEARKILP